MGGGHFIVCESLTDDYYNISKSRDGKAVIRLAHNQEIGSASLPPATKFNSLIAQPVEQLTVNQLVGGSSPSKGATHTAQIPKRPNGMDCKSVVREFESHSVLQTYHNGSVAERLMALVLKTSDPEKGP